MEFEIKTMPLIRNEGDYIKDGLLYCGKCHCKKQWRGRLMGKETIVPCLCKCGSDAREAEKEEKRKREHLEMIESRREYAFSGGKTKAEREENPNQDDSFRMIRWNFQSDDGGNFDTIKKSKNYAKHFAKFMADGRGLLFYGPTGTGKTFTACCIVNALIDAGYSAIVTNFAQIANELFTTYDKALYMERLLGCDLLFLDDLDIERDTGYMNETVYNVIDGRYRSGKPMIVTTNLTADKLKNPGTKEKQRVYSRIMDVCIPIVFTGEDRRYKKARERYKADLQILDEDVFE